MDNNVNGGECVLNNYEKSSSIIEDANEIIENYIKRKRSFVIKKTKKLNKFFLLSILTISILVILFCIIKFI